MSEWPYLALAECVLCFECNLKCSVCKTNVSGTTVSNLEIISKYQYTKVWVWRHIKLWAAVVQLSVRHNSYIYAVGTQHNIIIQVH